MRALCTAGNKSAIITGADAPNAATRQGLASHGLKAGLAALNDRDSGLQMLANATDRRKDRSVQVELALTAQFIGGHLQAHLNERVHPFENSFVST